jgi:hypothetical protein
MPKDRRVETLRAEKEIFATAKAIRAEPGQTPGDRNALRFSTNLVAAMLPLPKITGAA